MAAEPRPASAAARQAGNGADHQAAATAQGLDVVSGFPRGLPDGNPHRPLATARWPSEAETFDTHGRWLRLMIGMALEALERTGPLKENQHRVLFCLDEFAVLGHMQAVERAAGQIAGFGVKLWPVIQDLTQLQRDYQKAWETFMGNAGLLTFFGNTDLTTLEHISKRLGDTEIISQVNNVSETWQRQSGQSKPD